jgi:predicted nucleic acid-binding protein
MKILLDSDALLGLYLEKDAHHLQATKIFKEFSQKRAKFYVSNLVLQESTTLLSYRYGQKMAQNFLSDFRKSGFATIFIDEVITQATWKLFRKQVKKGTSFIDCSNVVLYRELNFDSLFSFDRFYRRFDLKQIV